MGKGSLDIPSGVLECWRVVILEDSKVPILRRNPAFMPERAYGHIPIILRIYPDRRGQLNFGRNQAPVRAVARVGIVMAFLQIINAL